MSSGLSSQGSWSSSGSDSSELDTQSRPNELDDDDLLNAIQEFQSPPRPSRTDYESYTALVRNIDKGDDLIVKKILAIRASEIRVSEPEDRQDGPHNEPNNESRSEGDTTRWPLQAGEIGNLVEVEALEDSILAFASAHIRQNQLVIPRQEGFRRQADLDSTELDELDERIPAFLPNIMDQIDSLLESLATMRPEETSRKRQTMGPMGWESIISAGVLSEIDPRVLSKTNAKMRELLNAEGEDIIEHRLSILRQLSQGDPELAPLSELYPSVKTKKDGVQRVHLSKKQLEERTMKREARTAKSRAKADRLRAEATNAAEMNDTRPIKRRRKADVA